VTLAFLLNDAFNQVGQAADAVFQGQGRTFVVQDRFFSVHLPQIRVKGRRCLSLDRDLENPEFLGNESLPFTFPVDDEAQGHGLDPACGQAAFDFLPEQGGNFVAYQPVQNTPGLL